MDPFKAFEDKMATLSSVLTRYSEVGARDTEPVMQLAYLLNESLAGGVVYELVAPEFDPDNPFSLYSDDPRLAEATEAITAAYREAAAAMLEVPMRHGEAVASSILRRNF